MAIETLTVAADGTQRVPATPEDWDEWVWSLTRFSGQFTCRHHAASAAAAGLLSYSTGLRSPIEV